MFLFSLFLVGEDALASSVGYEDTEEYPYSKFLIPSIIEDCDAVQEKIVYQHNDDERVSYNCLLIRQPIRQKSHTIKSSLRILEEIPYKVQEKSASIGRKINLFWIHPYQEFETHTVRICERADKSVLLQWVKRFRRIVKLYPANNAVTVRYDILRDNGVKERYFGTYLIQEIESWNQVTGMSNIESRKIFALYRADDYFNFGKDHVRLLSPYFRRPEPPIIKGDEELFKLGRVMVLPPAVPAETPAC